MQNGNSVLHDHEDTTHLFSLFHSDSLCDLVSFRTLQSYLILCKPFVHRIVCRGTKQRKREEKTVIQDLRNTS